MINDIHRGSLPGWQPTTIATPGKKVCYTGNLASTTMVRTINAWIPCILGSHDHVLLEGDDTAGRFTGIADWMSQMLRKGASIDCQENQSSGASALLRMPACHWQVLSYHVGDWPTQSNGYFVVVYHAQWIGWCWWLMTSHGYPLCWKPSVSSNIDHPW